MATYVIGDIQGCFTTLERLLERIRFDSARDRIWLVGDLVNRGPDSLRVLRWAKNLGDGLKMVLGNHDVHLIARAEGARERKRRDTLDDVLGAPDRESLIEWLLSRPLLYREDDYVLVHAGLLPSWSLEQAEALAWEASETLRSRRRSQLLEALYLDAPSRWSDEFADITRATFVFDVMTRLRTLTEDGEICRDYAGPPSGAPRGCRSWFEMASYPEPVTVLFGHWAALGLHLGERFIALDSGCVWGGALTAIRLEDRAVFQERCAMDRSS